MIHFRLNLVACVFLSLMLACKSARIQRSDDSILELFIVQVNDVYEIAPLGGGKEGGLARVASLKKQHERANPNTLLIMAGDFLSPSVYNSLQHQGSRIRGRQMVDVLNSAGLDIAMFGNHEFDISEEELLARLSESEFRWVSSNTFHRRGDSTRPFFWKGSSIPEKYVMHFRDRDGTTAKVGFIALTLPFNKADYVTYTEPLSAAAKLVGSLKDSCDAILAITHQEMEEDRTLARQLPEIDLIIGGHEHDMRIEKVGNAFITKAHANAKSAYILKITVNKKLKSVDVAPTLIYINSTIPEDTTVKNVVNKWVQIAYDNLASLGFNASAVVYPVGDSLEGREPMVRGEVTNLTETIVKAMKFASPQADVVMYNAGSIRLDDILYPPVSQYDIIRTLPYGGAIREVEMSGSLLIRLLEAGLANRGLGGFLHTNAHRNKVGDWLVDQRVIEKNGRYRVALTDFLLSGKEMNLEFLKDHDQITRIYPAESGIKSDIRRAVIAFLTE